MQLRLYHQCQQVNTWVGRGQPVSYNKMKKEKQKEEEKGVYEYRKCK